MPVDFQVTFDAADPVALARFWAVALGYQIQPPPEGFASWEEFGERIGMPRERWYDLAAIVDPEGKRPRVLFQKVPEDKTIKNRVHLDVKVSGQRDDAGWRKVRAHIDLLVAEGAVEVREYDEPTGRWVVMRDPEGNEFCVG